LVIRAEFMQWVSSFKSLQLRDTAVCVHSYRPPAVRQTLRLVCQATSAVADAPAKRKPGRPKKSAAGTSETATPVAEASDPSKEKPKKRKEKAKEPAVVPDESESVTEEAAAPVLPPPWAHLTPAQVEQQNAEIATLNWQREQESEERKVLDPKWHARESVSNALMHRDPEWLATEKKVFTQTGDV